MINKEDLWDPKGRDSAEIFKNHFDNSGAKITALYVHESGDSESVPMTMLQVDIIGLRFYSDGWRAYCRYIDGSDFNDLEPIPISNLVGFKFKGF